MTSNAKALAKAQKDEKAAASAASTPKKESPEEDPETPDGGQGSEDESEHSSAVTPGLPNDLGTASESSSSDDDVDIMEPFEPSPVASMPEPEPELVDLGVCHEISSHGKVGIVWEEVETGCVAINLIERSSLAAEIAGLEVGMVLQGIQISELVYQHTKDMLFEHALALTRTEDRPLRLFFARNEDGAVKIVPTEQNKKAQDQALTQRDGNDSEDDSTISSDDGGVQTAV
jgi:hypothetical protein